ncbi:MAG: 3-phosphoshikimate 1-carboxyvinyltransferase [Flavobacteriales bacterium]|nr:3-phosphoshikimate 1-carboxyvinyltransferase [Flavobacteriales bacterium]MBO72670.1 3-phosphoshikimate 1-carboxyvinyltransferase [Flavobacteriales bacterium]|tara:strand:+ start:2880 stop:4103 length:1224 start_codon:yes stop_codon:yes gene_type:complete
MDKLTIKAETKIINGEVNLTASKSESNRVLIIRALCDDYFPIHNLAAAKDTETMIQLLSEKGYIKDVGPAGTTMRFLTAFYANTPGKWILTGSERMKNRPISILVNALKKLGAKIKYLEKEGCPPLEIEGGNLKGGKISIDGSVSSQYLSALILIAPKLKGGLEMELTGKIASIPYLKMTLALIGEFGAKYSFEDNTIKIEEGKYQGKEFTVEADWSAASYWYQIAALADKAKITLKGLKEISLQGDSAIVEMFKHFGVQSTFEGTQVTLEKNDQKHSEQFDYDFSDCPDVAQTLAATITGLNIKGHFKGLESLRIKETDRIAAIKNELEKFGASIDILPDDEIKVNNALLKSFNGSIETYDDHRVAMSIAPLCLKVDSIDIEEPNVVAKSYPDFWKDLAVKGLKSS